MTTSNLSRDAISGDRISPLGHPGSPEIYNPQDRPRFIPPLSLYFFLQFLIQFACTSHVLFCNDRIIPVNAEEK